MQLIKIKPLSVNEAFQGRRFKTKKYDVYQHELLLLLKPFTLPPPPLLIALEFGFSNSASDIDNPLKPFIDVLQKKYGFNDKDIFELHVKKVKVKKGEDYIKFKIETIKN